MDPLVLIVEDNELNMELTTDVLVAAGLKVLQAGDAMQGIELARSRQPNVILMDISLPGMDGLQATAVLKKDAKTSNIPVIALTAHAMKGDKEKILSAGCDYYLTKPIDGARLVETVVQFVRPGSTVR